MLTFIAATGLRPTDSAWNRQGPLDPDANPGSVNLEPFALRDAGPAPAFLPRFEGVFDIGR